MKFNFDSDGDRMIAINALRTAKNQYEKLAKEFRKYFKNYDEVGTEFITKNGARELAIQFDHQAEDAERLMKQIIEDEGNSDEEA